MKEEQRLFFVQARSAFQVYKILKSNETLHHCHALHYLQMATELFSKANAWRNGPVAKSHKALVSFLRGITSNTKAQRLLGYEGQNENWAHTIRKTMEIAEGLQKMAPSLSGNRANPEYPWPTDAPITAPVEYDFPIWQQLTETSYGRALIALIHKLFDVADEFM
jgi:hypothetical protein